MVHPPGCNGTFPTTTDRRVAVMRPGRSSGRTVSRMIAECRRGEHENCKKWWLTDGEQRGCPRGRQAGSTAATDHRRLLAFRGMAIHGPRPRKQAAVRAVGITAAERQFKGGVLRGPGRPLAETRRGRILFPRAVRFQRLGLSLKHQHPSPSAAERSLEGWKRRRVFGPMPALERESEAASLGGDGPEWFRNCRPT